MEKRAFSLFVFFFFDIVLPQAVFKSLQDYGWRPGSILVV